MNELEKLRHDLEMAKLMRVGLCVGEIEPNPCYAYVPTYLR